jgi:autophagy-related protein 16
MIKQLKASGLEKLARQQIDGIASRSEEGSDIFLESNIPSTCKHRLQAHEDGCASILFQCSSNKLITGGDKDRTVKVWDTDSGSLVSNLYGCLGSVLDLDLTITNDNRSFIAASSSINLYAWDLNSGRVHHTLAGHTDKVCAVDVSKVSSHHVVSAAYDHTIKFWDLLKGYCINTIIFQSNCNVLSFSTVDRHYFLDMLMEIFYYGILKRENYIARLQHTHLQSHQYLFLEMEMLC